MTPFAPRECHMILMTAPQCNTNSSFCVCVDVVVAAAPPLTRYEGRMFRDKYRKAPIHPLLLLPNVIPGTGAAWLVIRVYTLATFMVVSKWILAGDSAHSWTMNNIAPRLPAQ